MPEVDRERLRAKLDTIPQQDREPYLKALKANGYTWKTGTSTIAATEGPTGDFTPEMEKAAWDDATKSGADYFQAKDYVLQARNKQTQGQKPGGLIDVAKGAAQVSDKLAFAAPKIAKGAVKAGADKLTESFPESKTASVASATAKFASEAIPTSSGELAAQAAGEKYAVPAIKALNTPAKKVLGFMAQKFGGLSQEATRVLETRAPAVMKYARMGIEGASESAAKAAKRLQDSLGALERDLSKQYADSVIERGIKRIGANTPVDISARIQPVWDKIEREYVLDDKAQKTVARLRADFDSMMSAPEMATLGGSSPRLAQIGDVHKFQKRLNSALMDASARGEKGLASALRGVKTELVGSLEGVLPELQKGNTAFREGMTLIDDLAKLDNADDVLRAVNSAMRNRGRTRDAISAFISRSPEAQSAFADAMAATAGKEAANWSIQLPQTGAKALYQTALGGSLYTAGHNPVLGFVSGATTLAGTSPRLYGEGFNLLSKKLPKVPKGTATAAIAALRSQRSQDE